MRERRPEDWRTDLSKRHHIEAKVAARLAAHPGLIMLKRSTSSTDRLDYQLLGPGERLIEMELKTKRQPYQGWTRYRPDVPEKDLFILDELALRRIVDAGRYAFLLVNDMPGRRWCLWSTADLVLTSKSRVARSLARGADLVKGKLLISLVEHSTVTETLAEAIEALITTIYGVDKAWDDIAPWPSGSKPALGA
ncbi:MAG: hypothetical protein QOK47_1077 [Actinomycetota bacterium]|jgi:hypothetical protein|nr:hypothetical protein [Actinomycetota bacterium]